MSDQHKVPPPAPQSHPPKSLPEAVVRARYTKKLADAIFGDGKSHHVIAHGDGRLYVDGVLVEPEANA